MKTTNLKELYATNPVKACRIALRRTAKTPWQDRMKAINEQLGGFGVEALRGNWQNGYWCDIVATYANVGDTYRTTVVHVRGEYDGPGRFVVSSWGDFVERHGEKLGVM